MSFKDLTKKTKKISADLYDIDLDAEYPAMLERLTKRIKKGELEE